MTGKRKSILRVLTNSERSSFACQRLWWFSYNQGLSQHLAPAPLRQGSLVHQCVEAWARSSCKLKAHEIEELVIEPWLEARRSWADSQKSEAASEAYQKDIEIAEMSLGLIEGYIKHWADDPDEWEIIAVEPQIARWLERPPQAGKMDGRMVLDRPLINGVRTQRRWAIGGKVDRIARSKSTGLVWQFETKTMTGSFDAYCRKLHFDPQTRNYAWIQRDPIRMYSSPAVSEPLRVEGTVYDLIRKQVPTVPRPLTKCKKCGHPESKHAGGWACEATKKCTCKMWELGSLSTAHIDTTKQAFLDAINACSLDPDDYADHLEKLPGLEAFFHREHYSFNDEDLEDFETDLQHHALQIVAAEKAKYHPRQTRVCQGFMSRGCPGGFESICLADGPLARMSYAVRTIRHAELEGDLAEPWVGQQRKVEQAPKPDLQLFGKDETQKGLEDPFEGL